MRKISFIGLIGGIVLSMMISIGANLGWTETQEEILSDLQKANINWKQFEGKEIKLLLYTVSWQAQIEKYIPLFEKLTGIKVLTETYEMASMRQKRTLDLASGVAQYDLWAFMPIHYGLEYYYAGWIEPLEKYIQNFKLTDRQWYKPEDLFQSVKDQGTLEGKLIYIPTTASSCFLMYRKDLFSKYGVSVPTTWEENYQAAAKLTRKEEGIYGMVMRGEGYSAASMFAQHFRSCASEWLDPPYYKPGGGIPEPVFNKDAGVRSLDYYSSILRNYGPPGIASYTWMDSNRFFMDGKAAMIFEDSVFAPEFENPEKSKVAGMIGYAPFPKPSGKWGPGKSFPAVAGYGLAISALSKNKEAAWLFIEFASSPILSEVIGLTGMPMSRASTWKSPKVRKQFPHPDFFETSLESFKNGDPYYMPRVRASTEIRKAIGVAITKALTGQDIQKALDESAASTKKIIAEIEVKK